MTIEEAGEIVLKGAVWVPCSACETLGVGESLVNCLQCDGAGYLVNTEAVHAYELLEMKLPRKPRTLMEKLCGEVLGLGWMSYND